MFLVRFILILLVYVQGAFADKFIDGEEGSSSAESTNSGSSVQGHYHALDLKEVSEEVLASFVDKKIFEIPEIAEISKIARQRGLKVWLMGGAAATITNFIRWDLLRTQGDKRFKDNYFNYSLEWILYPQQDLDFVVTKADGERETKEEIDDFMAAVRVAIVKTKAEARGLKISYAGASGARRDPVSEDLNFRYQNSDSMSLGAIDISCENCGVSRFYDLKSMNEPGKSLFLKDLARNQIEFVLSKDHDKSPRVKEGKNPPLITAIRFLSKAFQFGLMIDDEDRVEITSVINQWNERVSFRDSYVSTWINREAPKLLLLAVDLESAWNFLDEISLRQKLIHMDGASDNLRAFFNREPIRMRNHPKAHQFSWQKKVEPQVTAKDLDLSLVAHETDPVVARSIMSHPFGIPNFFISRRQRGGEAAVYGDGIYLKKGLKGAGYKSQGFHVRMTVSQGALEWNDFLLDGGNVIAANRSILEVEFPIIDIVKRGKIATLYANYLKAQLGDETLVAANIMRELNDYTKKNEIKESDKAEMNAAFTSIIDDNFENISVPVLENLFSSYKDYRQVDSILKKHLDKLLNKLILDSEKFMQFLPSFFSNSFSRPTADEIIFPRREFIVMLNSSKERGEILTRLVNEIFESKTGYVSMPRALEMFFYIETNNPIYPDWENLFISEFKRRFSFDKYEVELMSSNKKRSEFRNQLGKILVFINLLVNREKAPFEAHSLWAARLVRTKLKDVVFEVLRPFAQDHFFLGELISLGFEGSHILLDLFDRVFNSSNEEKIRKYVIKRVIELWMSQAHVPMRMRGLLKSIFNGPSKIWAREILQEYFNTWIRYFYLDQSNLFLSERVKTLPLEQLDELFEKMHKDQYNKVPLEEIQNALKAAYTNLINEGVDLTKLGAALDYLRWKHNWLFQDLDLSHCKKAIEKVSTPDPVSPPKKLPMPPPLRFRLRP